MYPITCYPLPLIHTIILAFTHSLTLFYFYRKYHAPSLSVLNLGVLFIFCTISVHARLFVIEILRRVKCVGVAKYKALILRKQIRDESQKI